MFEKFIQEFAAWLLRWLLENVGVTPQVYYPVTEILPKPEVTPRTQRDEIPWFKYIHPSVTEDDVREKVHREVSNLVQNFPMVDICKHLQQMTREKRVYLNIKPELMFNELHRIGMPDEKNEGFSYKNFMHHFNIK